MQTFANWLGTMLHQDEQEIKQLLENEAALQFLLAWALFESKCFGGYLQAANLKDFAEEVTTHADQLDDAIISAADYFHSRYQDRQKLNNLMPQKRAANWMVDETKKILNIAFKELGIQQIVLLDIYVVYRYRNNMFHGSKGVAFWLRFEKQIRLCVSVIQSLISFVEKKSPTFGAEAG